MTTSTKPVVHVTDAEGTAATKQVMKRLLSGEMASAIAVNPADAGGMPPGAATPEEVVKKPKAKKKGPPGGKPPRSKKRGGDDDDEPFLSQKEKKAFMALILLVIAFAGMLYSNKKMIEWTSQGPAAQQATETTSSSGQLIVPESFPCPDDKAVELGFSSLKSTKLLPGQTMKLTPDRCTLIAFAPNVSEIKLTASGGYTFAVPMSGKPGSFWRNGTRNVDHQNTVLETQNFLTDGKHQDIRVAVANGAQIEITAK